MKKNLVLYLITIFILCSCSDDDDNTTQVTDVNVTFSFTHHWDNAPVTSDDFDTFQFTNANGELLSIERLRYLISDITFTTSDNEQIVFDVYNLIDVTNSTNLSFTPQATIPVGNYTNVSFTFGFDNEDNSENYTDLNSASFNVPDMLGGGYHYMQFDGKFINSANAEQGFNYHAIRAVDNPGMNPTFPQDTFFTVNLGAMTISNTVDIEVEMNIAEWFRTPNQWNLNVLNTVLMPNSMAQIMMFENGQNVFSLGTVTP